MFMVESVWRLEVNLLVIKIIGIAKANNIMYIDNQVEIQMINKMVMVILAARQYNGIVLETVPNMPKDKNQIVVCSSIIFDTFEHLEEFKEACPKILNQE